MEVSRRLRKFRLSWWFFVPWYSSSDFVFLIVNRRWARILVRFLSLELKIITDEIPSSESQDQGESLVQSGTRSAYRGCPTPFCINFKTFVNSKKGLNLGSWTHKGRNPELWIPGPGPSPIQSGTRSAYRGCPALFCTSIYETHKKN